MSTEEQRELAVWIMRHLGVETSDPKADIQRRITFEDKAANLAELILKDWDQDQS